MCGALFKGWVNYLNVFLYIQKEKEKKKQQMKVKHIYNEIPSFLTMIHK